MSHAVKPVIYVVTGPTAVGKTELSLAWAERHDAEILSCDSLLFYRGMDIGTAKPTAAELRRVRHHLIDIVEPIERMDVKRYVAMARQVVDDCRARRKRVLVAGGSGFYLKAFFGPVADDVEVPAPIRQQVQHELETRGLGFLLGRLHELNPLGIGKLDTNNPRRVVRALERCLATNRTLADLAADFARTPGPFAAFDVRLWRLERPKAELAQRIAQRVEAMMTQGLVEEVARLRASGFEANASAAGAIGYRETLAYLRGEISKDALPALIARNTQALVKKQLTWFRTQLPHHAPLSPSGALPDP